MTVQRIVSDLLESNMYLILEGSGAIVIDPCRKLEMPEGVEPEYVILTHEHYDHISGVNVWKDHYPVKVICSKLCNERIQNSKLSMARYFGAFSLLQTGLNNTVPGNYEPDYACTADQVFDEDVSLTWRGHEISFMLLPGHSPGSAGIVIDNSLFSGDSLFEQNDTELRFPGGSARDWRDISLPKIRSLPPETTVYPGHFEPFKLINWPMYKI